MRSPPRTMDFIPMLIRISIIHVSIKPVRSASVKKTVTRHYFSMATSRSGKPVCRHGSECGFLKRPSFPDDPNFCAYWCPVTAGNSHLGLFFRSTGPQSGANPGAADAAGSPISLLTATLLVSPLARLLQTTDPQTARRPLGSYTFFYVALHLFILVGFDYRFDLPLLFATYLDKPFIWFGLITGLILAVLALTSIDWRKRRWDSAGNHCTA